MTQREEEILKKAKEEAWYIADTSQTKEEAVISGYCLGAKYADKTMIDKACEWLRRNMYEGTCEQISSRKPYPFMKDFIEEFKQSMEGGIE